MAGVIGGLSTAGHRRHHSVGYGLLRRHGALLTISIPAQRGERGQIVNGFGDGYLASMTITSGETNEYLVFVCRMGAAGDMLCGAPGMLPDPKDS